MLVHTPDSCWVGAGLFLLFIHLCLFASPNPIIQPRSTVFHYCLSATTSLWHTSSWGMQGKTLAKISSSGLLVFLDRLYKWVGKESACKAEGDVPTPCVCTWVYAQQVWMEILEMLVGPVWQFGVAPVVKSVSLECLCACSLSIEDKQF